MTILKDILDVFLTVAAAYTAVILILRASGKRTLSKLHAFDFIVTVCLGSIMASTIILPDLSIFRGMAGFASLVAMQYILSYLTMRFKPFKNIILAKPAILFYCGEFYEDTMWTELITMEDINETMRSSGFESYDDVKFIVLEAQGTLSVVPYSDYENPKRHSLIDVSNLPK